MAFEFPDPTITPEFTTQNGVTYEYDFDKELWHVQVVKEEMTPERVAPKFKSLNHLTYHQDSSSYKCYKLNGNSAYSVKLEGITRFAARNPETNRIIVITDKGHLTYSDDDGATWQSNPSDKPPGAYNYYQGSDTYYTGYHEDPPSRWTWCGGKRWMAFNTNWCRIAWTDNDFENVYACRFNPHNLGGSDDKPPRAYRYDAETDEMWWLMSDGYVLQIDPDISKWMDAVKGTIEQYGFNPALPSNMPGVIQRRKLYFRTDGWSNTYTGYFDNLAISPHGTKVAWAAGGVCIRTEDDFSTYTPANVAGWSYDHRFGNDLYDDKRTPNAYYRRIYDCYYVKETDVWIACGVKDLYVSFDDAKTWQGVEYNNVANAYDVGQGPYISLSTDGTTKYHYYGSTTQSNCVGYTKGMYLYQTLEMTVPEYYKYFDKSDNATPYSNYTYEKVLYASADLKNWTRTILPTSKETKLNCGPFTFIEDREAFLCGYGSGENEKTKHLVYFDSYI